MLQILRFYLGEMNKVSMITMNYNELQCYNKVYNIVSKNVDNIVISYNINVFLSCFIALLTMNIINAIMT